MSDVLQRVFDNAEIQEFLEFICIDGYIFYIYKNKFDVNHMELFFWDRYLGFEHGDNNTLRFYSNGLNDFLIHEGIMKHICIKPEEIYEVYFNDLRPNNFQVLVETYFDYPDEITPFKYYSYIMINDISEDKVCVTKIANIDPKVRIELSREKFEGMLNIHDGMISMYAYKNSNIFSKLDNQKPLNKIKNISKLMQIEKDKIESVYNEKSKCNTVIKDILTFHQSKLSEYLLNGVQREKYPLFIRRISEAIKPSLVCIEEAKNIGIVVDKRLEREKNNVESTLYKASNNILAFFFRNQEKYFEQYSEQMINLDIFYKQYMEEYHAFIMNLI